MGELLICNEPIAALPYYIEGISWNVYSIEELCYYIENNTYLLEKGFMTEELCTWVGKEIKNVKLADRLRNIMQVDGRLSEFVLAILAECGYCSGEAVQEIVGIVREMEEKSDFECSKVRADRLMEKEKYLSSIYEYKSLLESNEAGEQTRELLGSIWHNLGTAYARLFLFGEAAHCYEKAYHLNQNMESIKEGLMAYYCLGDEAGLSQMVEKYQVSGEMIQAVQHEISHAGNSEATGMFEKKIDALSAMGGRGAKSEYQKNLSKMIFKWKEEYRRICRI